MADDYLKIRAENVMKNTLERRFGVTATYSKKGAQAHDGDGNLTYPDAVTFTDIRLVPTEVNQNDMARAGLDHVEQSIKVFKGRHSVLGDDLSSGDEITIDGVIHEVIDPAILDGIGVGVTWRILTRRIT